MSDYTQVTDFSAKDALTSGDPEKIISGADVDVELAAISTAIATKYDVNDIASQAQAEAETSNSVLITPLRLANWADANGGMVGDIQALADPGADTVLGWDDSAGAAIGWTIGTGLLTTAGGVLELDFLGIEDLVDPNADRIYFWDDGAGASAWLTATNGLEIATTNLGIADVTAGAAQPVVITSGTFTFDLSSITELTIENLSQSADGVLISDAGTLKVMPYDSAGFKVQTAQTTQTLALTDANTVMEFDGTATVTIPIDATHTWEAGSAAIICTDHATQVVTITAAATVTLNSVNHPGGAAAASDAVRAGGTAVLLYLGGDEWYLSGDIQD